MDIDPFHIRVPQAALDDLRARLAATRLPDDPGPGWDYGMPLQELRQYLHHWQHTYDWRVWEARLNAYPQGLAHAAGERLHFLHVHSPEPEATPLVLTHGWPGSVMEFLEVLGPLSDPVAHGGKATDAFHVVCPSLPGYGFSGPTSGPGVDIHQAADAVADLMAQLGYPRYIAQGGDWGAVLTRRLAEAYPERLLGAHFNMLFAMPEDLADPQAWEGVTEAELNAFQSASERIVDGTGYMAIQSTRPQTLAYGLNDSPAGLAAWILEKFHAWVDAPEGVHNVLDRDRLLTNVMLYWLTGTAGSAARLYCESARAGTAATDPWSGRIEVPTGFARYPGELLQTPKVWAERRYNLVYFNEQPRGGHFAAFEQPQLFVEDLRCFREVLRGL